MRQAQLVPHNGYLGVGGLSRGKRHEWLMPRCRQHLRQQKLQEPLLPRIPLTVQIQVRHPLRRARALMSLRLSVPVQMLWPCRRLQCPRQASK